MKYFNTYQITNATQARIILDAAQVLRLRVTLSAWGTWEDQTKGERRNEVGATIRTTNGSVFLLGGPKERQWVGIPCGGYAEIAVFGEETEE